ncbi:cytochrome c [Paenibacillus lentus]|uniref:c-type cytochrome n=1 Tax=Paenibacillus lentus TaxID=1338368 RepID=UPI003653757E
MDTAQAEAVYQSNCLVCHGDEFQGRSDSELTIVGAKMTREAIYKKIIKGGGGMPSFEKTLPGDVIVNLMNWLATFQ